MKAERALGPMPRETLRALHDLGLEDGDIGRYYRIDPLSVERLRMRHGILQRGNPDGRHAC